MRPTHPTAQERAKRCPDWRIREPQPFTIETVPATWPRSSPREWRSTWHPTHPLAQGQAKRCPDCQSRESRAVTIGTVPNPTDLLAETRPPRLVPHLPIHPGTSEATSRLALQRTLAFTIGTVPSTEFSAIQRSSAPRGTGRRGGGGGLATEARASLVEACPGGQRRHLGPEGGPGGRRVRCRTVRGDRRTVVAEGVAGPSGPEKAGGRLTTVRSPKPSPTPKAASNTPSGCVATGCSPSRRSRGAHAPTAPGSAATRGRRARGSRPAAATRRDEEGPRGSCPGAVPARAQGGTDLAIVTTKRPRRGRSRGARLAAPFIQSR